VKNDIIHVLDLLPGSFHSFVVILVFSFVQYGDFDPDLYQQGFLANEKILPQKVGAQYLEIYGMQGNGNVQ